MANLVWKDLKVIVKSKNKSNGSTLLSFVSGCVGPDDILALMGPSGSSKTTLLDVLAGRLSSNLSRSGSIFLNGRESNLSYGVAAYVRQEDVLMGTLTVKETLMFVARLRLPPDVNGQTREQRVEDVIAELGLKEAADVSVGNWYLKGISGGQRRRLSIGCELLISPKLLFLDEPTSGLDAASAYFVMKGIRALAERGRTVITVIHQPSSEVFDLFDKLCLLSTGRLVYFGDAVRAIDLFRDAGLPCPERVNPADHFLHCTNRDFDLIETEVFESVDAQITALINTFDKSTFKRDMQAACERLSAEGDRYRGPSKRSRYIQRAAALTWRTLLDYVRNLGVFWMRVAMYVLLCICIGTIYFDMGKEWIEVQSRANLMFFVTAFLTFMSIAAFPAYIEELQVYTKEVLNGYYTTSVYVIASTVASAPFLFLIAISSTVCAYFLAGLNSDAEAFFYFVLNLYLALMVTEALMLCIAVMVPHYLMGIAGGAGVMGLYMLVCGFFQARDELPDPVWRYPLHYVSFHTYAFTGLINNEFRGTGQVWRCPCSLTAQPDDPNCPEDCFVTGDDVIDSFTVENRDKWIDLAVLAGMFVGYRLLFLFFLKMKELKQKAR